MAIVEIENLTKTYDGGFQALKGVKLDIQEGEILALLGPNGAGKTTLISTICGITTPTAGQVRVGERRMSACQDQKAACQYAHVKGSPENGSTRRGRRGPSW